MTFKTETEAFNYAETTGKHCAITKTKTGWKVEPIEAQHIRNAKNFAKSR
jgi:hypothetical protein